MSSDVAPIPPVLDEVDIPRYFGPSSFEGLSECPLSVINRVPKEEKLLPHPNALLGSLLHELVEKTEAMPEATFHEIGAFVDRAIADEEAKLASDPRLHRFGGLRSIVGRLECQRQKNRAINWISEKKLGCSKPGKRMTVTHTLAPDAGMSTSVGDTSETVYVPLGAERTLRSAELRLSGKVDLLEKDDRGVYHVTDYKTGRISEADGEVKPAYARQIGLYALMIKRIEPDAEVKLWLKGERTAEIPFDVEAEDELRTLLYETSRKFPPETGVAARDIANVGPACTFCRIRHRCSSYREKAPDLWKSKSPDGRVAPYDIWGRVESVTSSGKGQDVRLKDAAGRAVRIRGLPITPGLAPGSEVMYFSLESPAGRPTNGIYSHPRSFHAESPSIAWKNADSFEVFVKDG